jgi:hypothetical protein
MQGTAKMDPKAEIKRNNFVLYPFDIIFEAKNPPDMEERPPHTPTIKILYFV